MYTKVKLKLSDYQINNILKVVENFLLECYHNSSMVIELSKIPRLDQCCTEHSPEHIHVFVMLIKAGMYMGWYTSPY